MSHFFKVKTFEQVLALVEKFPCVDTERISVSKSCSRILAKDLTAKKDLPGFRRATMDGYAILASSSFGASESSPAWLEIAGRVDMGQIPDFEIMPGQAAKISTGGMLPGGADSVVMVEHTETVGDASVEIYKSVAPLQHVIDSSEDFSKDELILKKGSLLRPQETGLAAGLGFAELEVFKIPKVGIISTGDEIIPVEQEPAPGQIRDINSYTLAGFVQQAGAEPVMYGIIKDDLNSLKEACKKAIAQTDMVLVSGGSSVGTRDYTVDVLTSLENTTIELHGISISPGKPTILADSDKKPVWGLPGQVVSAMVVFKVVVMPFLRRLKGESLYSSSIRIPAVLSRNVASAQGRKDFIRVRLETKENQIFAHPVLGKSGLIRTMVLADGLLEIAENKEGLEKGARVDVMLLL